MCIRDSPIPLSSLQHWAYCPRQCGLIHLEQAFDDNVLLHQAQHRVAADDAFAINLARGLGAGKLRNQRALLLRGAREAKAPADEAALTRIAQEHRRQLARTG